MCVACYVLGNTAAKMAFTFSGIQNSILSWIKDSKQWMNSKIIQVKTKKQMVAITIAN